MWKNTNEIKHFNKKNLSTLNSNKLSKRLKVYQSNWPNFFFSNNAERFHIEALGLFETSLQYPDGLSRFIVKSVRSNMARKTVVQLSFTRHSKDMSSQKQLSTSVMLWGITVTRRLLLKLDILPCIGKSWSTHLRKLHRNLQDSFARPGRIRLGHRGRHIGQDSRVPQRRQTVSVIMSEL